MDQKVVVERLVDEALRLEEGVGTRRNRRRAFQLFLKAASMGSVRALYCLARCYRFGLGVPANEQLAQQYLNAAAKGGDPDALYVLGGQLLLSKSGDKKLRGFKLLLAAAEEGQADAQVKVASCYSEGTVVRKSKSKAACWYSKAASQNHPLGLYNLGWCQQTGYGIAQDAKAAAASYAKAAELGDSTALLNLGFLYSRGLGVRQSDSKAIEYYSAAAKAGEPAAMYNLALRLLQGPRVNKADRRRARTLLERSAKLGYAQAEVELRGTGAA